MKREIEVKGRTISLLESCLYAKLREGALTSDLEYFIEVRDFIKTLRELHALGVDLEDNPVILNIKG